MCSLCIVGVAIVRVLLFSLLLLLLLLLLLWNISILLKKTIINNQPVQWFFSCNIFQWKDTIMLLGFFKNPCYFEKKHFLELLRTAVCTMWSSEVSYFFITIFLCIWSNYKQSEVMMLRSCRLALPKYLISSSLSKL